MNIETHNKRGEIEELPVTANQTSELVVMYYFSHTEVNNNNNYIYALYKHGLEFDKLNMQPKIVMCNINLQKPICTGRHIPEIYMYYSFRIRAVYSHSISYSLIIKTLQVTLHEHNLVVRRIA